jgi:hypothetical protein
MRYPGIINFRGGMSRFGVVVAVAMVLLVGSAVRAVEMQDLTAQLPRGYFGEFLWDGDKVMQNVVITFESVRALNGQNAEALVAAPTKSAAR